MVKIVTPDGLASLLVVVGVGDPLHFRSSSDPILNLSILRASRSSEVRSSIDLRAFQFQHKCSHIVITGHQRTVANIDNFSRITKSQFLNILGPKKLIFMPFLVIFSNFGTGFSHNSKFSCPNGAKIDQLGIVDPYFDHRSDPIRPKKLRVERS